MRQLKRALTPPLILLAALLLWFWEWLWEPLEQLMARIGRLPLLRLADAWIAAAPPYAALLCFVIPGAALLPFKLAALYFIAHGAPLLGVATFLAAKVVGTALIAHIFALTRSQLLHIEWFARAYRAVVSFRNRVFATLHSHPLYLRVHHGLLALRTKLRSLSRGLLYHLARRWRAIRRRSRRSGERQAPPAPRPPADQSPRP